MRKTFTSTSKTLLFVFFAAIFFVLAPFAQAADTGRFATPPNFPRCEDKLAQGRGDRSHLDSGVHGIPGKGNLEGRDDVYTLSDGNFVQCFCPASGNTGIQSNWWYINGLPLGRVDIDAYERDGWLFEENGSDWNLLAGPYLIKNSDFSCSGATPSVTPRATATASVTPTNAPTATPGPTSQCSALTASPREGTAPLTVKFTGSGNDPNGSIQSYEFNFDDVSNNQQQVVQQTGSEVTHVYNNAGTFTATLKVKDSAGTWKGGNSECRQTIIVKALPGVIGASDTDQLPDTGLPLWSFFGLMIVGEVGYLVYKRFQLV
jgi:hypothetical protein